MRTLLLIVVGLALIGCQGTDDPVGVSPPDQSAAGEKEKASASGPNLEINPNYKGG